MIVDDVWAVAGSANLNRRSWTHDSEIACAVLDRTKDTREPLDPAGLGDGARVFARNLRLQLWREHLADESIGDADLLDPLTAFQTMATSAQRLQTWYAGGQVGPRPPGRLRPHHAVPTWAARSRWVPRLCQLVMDPDGRPRRLRSENRL
jgi:phosphatidylserine/phosphatidylglycerophosphate/cardiolipin synthase-like enzyme